MTYAMTLDNSWEIMNEEEMYDVNGGWGWMDKKIQKAIDFVVSGIAWTLVALGAKMTFAQISAGLLQIRAFSHIWTAVRITFFDFKFLAGVILIGTGIAMAIYL